MKKILSAVIVAGMVMGGSMAFAGDPDFFYASASLGVSVDANTGNYDTGYFGSIALGNRIQEHIRLEAEYQFNNNDVDIDDESDTDVSVNSLMGNIYYDFGTWSGLTPYATAGLGVGWFDMGGHDVDETSIVTKIGAGADYMISDKWSVGARYTYMSAVQDLDYDMNLISAVVTMSF